MISNLVSERRFSPNLFRVREPLGIRSEADLILTSLARWQIDEEAFVPTLN
jgi:hypothetical protein